MKIIRVRDKHDTYDVEADDLGAAALGILTQRWEEGYWYDEPEVEGAQKVVDELEAVLASLSQDSTLRAETERRLKAAKHSLSYETKHGDWYDWAKRVVEEKITDWPEGVNVVQLGHTGEGRSVYSRQHGPLAWLLLEFRKDAEYEGVELTETRPPRKVEA